ncbi:carboxyl transferase domain-containing protein, partial [Streptomyces pseudovenezuelae]|uniref:carboxyl transferase domain-containing protein n=1 Tax=Streptomyces pseudovenezuelae TaxID=67350 RepID=UPI0034A2F32F
MTERQSAREMVALLADDFREIPYPERQSKPDGPLAWQGYDASCARAAERTGERESVVCGTARVEGTRAVLIAFEFGFLGGSLGERTGDRLEAAYTYAREHRLPVVPLVATGGAVFVGERGPVVGPGGVRLQDGVVVALLGVP